MIYFYNLFSVLFLSFNIFFFSAVNFLSPACFFGRGPPLSEEAQLCRPTLLPFPPP